MNDKHIEGKPCRGNHVTESGKTIRYKANDQCVQCCKEKRQISQSNSARYKEYQSEYQKRLRVEHPERIEAYAKTQIERGHTYKYYYDKNKAAAITYTEQDYLAEKLKGNISNYRPMGVPLSETHIDEPYHVWVINQPSRDAWAAYIKKHEQDL